MKIKYVFYICCLISFFFGTPTQAQSYQSLKRMYSKIESQIDKKERNGEKLFFMQCDFLTDGLNQKLAVLTLQENYSYHFYVRVTNEVRSASFILMDSTIEDRIVKKDIRGGSYKTFTVQNHQGLVWMGLRSDDFSEDDLQATYAIIITRSSDNDDDDDTAVTIVEDDEEEEGSLTQIDGKKRKKKEDDEEEESCNYSAIKNLKFKTTTRWSKRGKKRKTNKKNHKSTVIIGSSAKTITIKMRRKGKETYRVRKVYCKADDVFKVSAENDMGYRFIITIDKTRNSFEILPEGGKQSSVFDMTKMNK